MQKISDENLTELSKRYRMTVFIVLAQIFVVFLLLLISLFAGVKATSNLTEQDFTTLWVGVLFIAVGSFILRRMFFNWERLKNIAVLKGVSGLLKTLQRNSVILALFGLIVGIIGFLIATFSGNGLDMFRTGIIAFVVFLINFPRKKIWKTIVSNVEQI